MQNCDCKKCVYGEILYKKDYKDKAAPFKSYRLVECSAPKYRGRKWPVREKTVCDQYKARERNVEKGDAI